VSEPIRRGVPVRLGVLGLGAVAQAVHLPLVARRPDLFRLAGIADLSLELCAVMGERYNVPPSRRHGSLGELLDAGGLDAVMILARGSHAQQVAAVLDAGLPVFCEKPLAYTVAEVDELTGGARSVPAACVLLGYMKQYDPAVVSARSLLAGIDDVRSVDVTVLHPTGASQLAFAHVVPPPAPLSAGAQDEAAAQERRLASIALGEGYDESLWRAYRGALVGSLAHDLSVMRSLRQRPLGVEHADIWRQSSRFAVRDIGRDRGSFGDHPPSVQATGRLGGGGRYSLAWHYLPDFPAYRETVRVVHGRGSVELVFPSPYLMHAPTELRVTSLDGEAESTTVRRSTEEAFESQLEAFARMIRDGAEPYSGLAEGRADILLCQSIISAFAERAGVLANGEIGALTSRTPA
jgi:myo-inositol 2-dehydrogenase / D-chiro-inositol 1-dehydrogenase